MTDWQFYWLLSAYYAALALALLRYVRRQQPIKLPVLTIKIVRRTWAWRTSMPEDYAALALVLLRYVRRQTPIKLPVLNNKNFKEDGSVCVDAALALVLLRYVRKQQPIKTASSHNKNCKEDVGMEDEYACGLCCARSCPAPLCPQAYANKTALFVEKT